jgi:hypothetical protein
MSRVHQIQLRYDAQEDRSLLRINTLDKREYTFWMTRRFTKLLWPVLVRMLGATDSVVRQPDPAAKSAVLSFEHEKAVSSSDFATEYREDAHEAPLGTSPLLLAKIEVKPEAPNGPRLGLLPMEGQGLELVMDDKLLHSICTLISQAARSADWDLDFTLGEQTTSAQSPPPRLN